jgi:hypothetical protein
MGTGCFDIVVDPEGANDKKVFLKPEDSHNDHAYQQEAENYDD